MIIFIFSALWFFAPAGIANMAPVFAAKLPVLKRLEYPLDFFTTYRGQRLLGEHKTIRGLLAGIIVGIGVVYFQGFLLESFPVITDLLNYNPNDYSLVLLGALLGGGAILGDAVESFFKRQRKLESGERWFGFDQIDFILGAILLSFWYAPRSIAEYSVIIICYFGFHILTTAIGYLLGLKDRAV